MMEVDKANFLQTDQIEEIKKPDKKFAEVMGTNRTPYIWKPSRYKFNPEVRIHEHM